MTTPRAPFPKRFIGQFAEAAEASLVVYDANPVKDLNTLRKPRLAIKEGELIAR